MLEKGKKFLKKVVDYNIFYKKRFNRPKYIQAHLNFMFEDIKVLDKNILDVGGGAGLLALFAAFNGANKAICLEPELEGSTAGFRQLFNNFKKESGITTNAENLNETFQSFCPKSTDKFDVVIFHNSINHLDETACQHLPNDQLARKSYNTIFTKLNNLLNENGVVIITDCSRRNFFNDCGFKSPFASSIEWNKHQNPEIWIQLLKESGFSDFRVTWTSHEAFGRFGQFLLGNRFFSYFTFSHFKLLVKK